MKMINKMGLAASLVLASSLATANVFDLDALLGNITATTSKVTTDASTGGSGVLGGTYSNGAFSDTFNFTLTQGNNFSAGASSHIDSISEFNLISVGGIDGVTEVRYDFSHAYVSGTAIGMPHDIFLSAGSYSLNIVGTATSSDSGYGLTLVTAVPEPSAIALLLGGLGLVGFMATRSKKKKLNLA